MKPTSSDLVSLLWHLGHQSMVPTQSFSCYELHLGRMPHRRPHYLDSLMTFSLLGIPQPRLVVLFLFKSRSSFLTHARNRATSHSILRAHDQYTSSTLIG